MNTCRGVRRRPRRGARRRCNSGESTRSKHRYETSAAARVSRRCGTTSGSACVCWGGIGRSPQPRSSRLRSGWAPSGTVFGLLNALRLRSLPVAHAAELAEIQIERTSLLQTHRPQPPGVAAALAGDRPPAAGVFCALRVCRYSLQPGAAGRGPLRRGPVCFWGILPSARCDGSARPDVDAGRRSGRLCKCAGRYQPRAVAGRLRRRRGRPVANTLPPLGAPPHRRHRSRNLPRRGGGPPFRGGAPRLRRGIRSSRSLVARGDGPACARVDAVRR